MILRTAPFLLAAALTALPAHAAPEVLPSGVQLTLSHDGTGPTPSAQQSVRVHYRGTLTDGREFDSSYGRGAPAVFPLNRVIPCWTEGLQRLRVGARARLVCPPETAYGNRGAGTVIPPNATLTFDVELLEILR